MKQKEFNLSEKEYFAGAIKFYKKADVKEFIKRLKKEFEDLENYYNVDVMSFKDWCAEKIDKLAGDKFKEIGE